MSAVSQDQTIIEKLADFVSWLTQDRWQIVSSQTVDALHTEIYELERSLAKGETFFPS